MLAYKRYLLPAVIAHTQSYLEQPDTSYGESRKSDHVPLVHEGRVAEPDTPEEDKCLEEPSRLAPSTVYRWVSWLDKMLPLIERSTPVLAQSERNFTPWQVSGLKQCRPERRKVLVRARQTLDFLTEKTKTTNLATVHHPP